jgi:hypothetical protein
LYYASGKYYLYRTPVTLTASTTKTTAPTTKTTTTSSSTTKTYTLNYFGTTISYTTTTLPPADSSQYKSQKETLLYSRGNVWKLYLPLSTKIESIGTEKDPIVIEKQPSSTFLKSTFEQNFERKYKVYVYFYSNKYYFKSNSFFY